MTDQLPPDQSEAARLLRALEQPDDLSCAEAEALLPDLIEAERAGADVDADPAFAALLRHLDACPDCLELYGALTADLDAVEAASLPPLPGPPPRVFTTAVKADNVLLRLVGALRDRFELAVAVPRAVPVAASSQAQPLFAGSLPEVAASPELELLLLREPAPALRVRLSPAAPWLVRLTLAGRTYEARTDSTGTATLSGFPPGDLADAPRLDLLFARQPPEA